ncbi:peptidylprolyl isomerase [Ilyomonas limi]|uniref:Peptidyl-prolyl cis-trans isomerase n=1 Tax=Ilyomonas limi TaxID=2575867 RepID=A0A4U3L4X4_9BACT|nr:peptidylprolyl isomerase [Ilyomonas limi]TKK70251.1 peptidylprolyl isomerase [Ilyomonas limi]
MQRWYYSIALIAIIVIACSSPKYKYPHVIISTGFGDIEAEIYTDKAPKTATAFLRYVDSGLYNRSYFYRILSTDNQPSNAAKAKLIQGGIWKTAPSKSIALPGIPHETTQQTGIHHTDGILSMARQAPGTATTEFFICVGNQPGFDYGGENNPDGQGYAAFGKVVKGMDVVRKIYDQPEEDQAFMPPVAIISIKRL